MEDEGDHRTVVPDLRADGFGKSTLLRRICLGDIARGTRVLVPGDLKPDLRRLTEAVEGQVSEVGYGTGSNNPLARGPIGEAIAQLPEGSLERERAEFALHARQLNMTCALLEIVRRGPLRDFEETMLASAIRLLYAEDSEFSNDKPALMQDLIDVIAGAPDELMEDAVADSAEEYRAQIKPLLRSMRALVKGRFGETFNRHSTVRIDISKPMVCLDVSSVPPGDELMRAAVLLSGWNEAFAAARPRTSSPMLGWGRTWRSTSSWTSSGRSCRSRTARWSREWMLFSVCSARSVSR